MKTLIASIVILLVSTALPLHALTNSEIKAQLKAEVEALQKDLGDAQGTVAALTQDKQQLEKNLSDMQTWGAEQQALASSYWDETQRVKIEMEKVIKHDVATTARYHRIKLLCALLAGLFAMIMYLKNNVTNSLIGMVGGLSPYTGIVQIIAPVLVFIAGFALIWFPL